MQVGSAMPEAAAARQRPMRADARRNYERVLAQAKIAFAEHGVDASLEDIARRAGVGIGTVYRHFPTRQALLEAVFQERFDALRSLAGELADSREAGEALDAWLRAFAEHATASRGMPASVKAAVTDKQSELGSSCQAMHAAGGEMLARAQKAGTVRPEITASDMLRLVNAVAWATEESGARTDVDRLLGVVLAGLRR